MTTIKRQHSKDGFGELIITIDNTEDQVIIKIALRNLLTKYKDCAQHPGDDPDAPAWWADQIAHIEAMLQQI
jgi:hypothetical protein